MKRIAYRRFNDEPNKLISQKFIGSQNAIYEVEIDTEAMTYRVRNVKQRKIVRSNEIDKVKPPKHIYTLKCHAKDALKKMGVKFELEIRREANNSFDETKTIKEIKELLGE